MSGAAADGAKRAQKIHENTAVLADVVRKFSEMEKDHQIMKQQLTLIVSRIDPSASIGGAVSAAAPNAAGRGRGTYGR
jgi:hypothetical protein